MSEENVEVVRACFDAWNAAAAEQMPAWVAEFWEPDGDFYPARGFPEARPCHGQEEIADFLVGLREPWDYRVAIKDMRAIGNDRVLLHSHVRAEGARAVRAWKGTSISACGCGTDDFFGSKIT